MTDHAPTLQERRKAAELWVARRKRGFLAIIGAVICLVLGLLMLAVLTGEI